MPYGQFSCVTCFHSEYLRLITDIGDYGRLRNSMYFLLQLKTYNLQLLLLLFQREFAGGEAVVVAEELYGVVAGGEGGVHVPVDGYAADFLTGIFD